MGDVESPSALALSMNRPHTGLLSQAAAELVRPSGSRPRGPGGERSLAASASSLGRRMATPDGAGRRQAVKSFDRRLSREFVEHEQHENVGASWGAGTPNARPNKAPSCAARRENFKKEQYAARIERGEEALGGTRSTLKGTARGGLKDALDLAMAEKAMNVDQLVDTFQEDLLAVNHRLDDIARSLRMENMETKEELAKRLELEEARRRREAERRAARKREQAARDPHRKVALRLENTRRFGEMEEGGDKQGDIPMQKLETVGLKGKETVNLVDVRMLRARCLQIEGGSVESLLDLQKFKENKSKLSSTARGGLTPLGSSCSVPALSSTMGASSSWEDRYMKAVELKQHAGVDFALKRLNAMRGDLPDVLPSTFDVVQKHMQRKSSRQETRPTSDMSENWQELLQRLAGKLAVSPGASNDKMSRALMKTLGSLSPTDISPPASPKGKSSSDTTVPKVKRKGGKELLLLQEAARKRARRRWRLLRMANRWIWLLNLVRSRTKSTEIIKVVLSEIGEHTRMKVAMFKVIASVRMLQQKCREFIAIKRKRCEIMTKQWQKIEDHNLAYFFSTYAVKVMQDNKTSKSGIGPPDSKSKRKKEDFLDKLQDGLKDGSLAIDWRAFRIPVKERQKVISRYYMAQLRKRVHLETGLVDCVATLVKKHRDLVGFLRSFGATEDPGMCLFGESDAQPGGPRSNTPPPVKPPFYSLSEENCLNLIALAAHALAHVKPFEDHPACKDLPWNVMYRKPLRDATGTKTSSGEGVVGSPELDRAVGRLCQQDKQQKQEPSLKSKSSKKSSETTAQGAAGPDGARDLEAVFEGFTPRLREIVDEQSLEYKLRSNPGSTERGSTPSTGGVGPLHDN